MFDLPHVASRLYGTPLLVARPKLEVILQALGPRFTGEPLAASDVPPAERGQLRITEAGIAVLPIMGTLVRRSSHLSAVSGLTSYHDIEADAQEAFTNPDVQGVLLEIDSGGGEASGLFDLVDALRDMAKSTGKPIWAVADEAALSAAYAIACAADKIFLPRTAEVGSVGVVAVHVDESGADAQAGLAYWTRTLCFCEDGLPTFLEEFSSESEKIPGITRRLGDEPENSVPGDVLVSFAPRIGRPHEQDYQPIGGPLERPNAHAQGHDRG